MSDPTFTPTPPEDVLDCLGLWFEAYPSEIAAQLNRDVKAVLCELGVHRDAGLVVSRVVERRTEADGFVLVDLDRYRLTSKGWQQVMDCADDVLSTTILDECDARGWSLLDLARAMGDREPVTAALALSFSMACWRDPSMRMGDETAAGLARAFDGSSVDLWRNLDVRRRLGYPRGPLSTNPAEVSAQIDARMAAVKAEGAA